MGKQQDAIELIEVKGMRSDPNPRFKVMLDGVQVSELYHNMRGYVGYLPCPSESAIKGYANLDIGEKNITRYRMEVKKLNKEWREHRKL